MKIWKAGILALGLWLTGNSNGLYGQEGVSVVPYPQEVSLDKGVYKPSGASISLRISGLEGETPGIILEQLTTVYRDRYGLSLSSGNGDRADVWIGIPSEDSELMELARKKALVPGEELGDEGYLLKIEKNKIYITAHTTAGVFYGVQSLRQLLGGNPAPLEVPMLTIRDWPSLAFRCIMDDISRGPIPTKAYMKMQIRRYAAMKINNMSFYRYIFYRLRKQKRVKNN